MFAVMVMTNAAINTVIAAIRARFMYFIGMSLPVGEAARAAPPTCQLLSEALDLFDRLVAVLDLAGEFRPDVLDLVNVSLPIIDLEKLSAVFDHRIDCVLIGLLR